MTLVNLLRNKQSRIAGSANVRDRRWFRIVIDHLDFISRNQTVELEVEKAIRYEREFNRLIETDYSEYLDYIWILKLLNKTSNYNFYNNTTLILFDLQRLESLYSRYRNETINVEDVLGRYPVMTPRGAPGASPSVPNFQFPPTPP